MAEPILAPSTFHAHTALRRSYEPFYCRTHLLRLTMVIHRVYNLSLSVKFERDVWFIFHYLSLFT